MLASMNHMIALNYHGYPYILVTFTDGERKYIMIILENHLLILHIFLD